MQVKAVSAQTHTHTHTSSHAHVWGCVCVCVCVLVAVVLRQLEVRCNSCAWLQSAASVVLCCWWSVALWWGTGLFLYMLLSLKMGILSLFLNVFLYFETLKCFDLYWSEDICWIGKCFPGKGVELSGSTRQPHFAHCVMVFDCCDSRMSENLGGWESWWMLAVFEYTGLFSVIQKGCY